MVGVRQNFKRPNPFRSGIAIDSTTWFFIMKCRGSAGVRRESVGIGSRRGHIPAGLIFCRYRCVDTSPDVVDAETSPTQASRQQADLLKKYQYKKTMADRKLNRVRHGGAMARSAARCGSS